METHLFTHNDYKNVVNLNAERGIYAKLAQHLNVHTTLISHIFKGDKHLSLEQAALVADFFGYNDLETEYFMALVQKEKAGNVSYRSYAQKQVEQLKEKSKKLSERIPIKAKLTEQDKAIFYSQWYYSGLRLLASIPTFANEEKIKKYFDLPAKTINEVLNFLLKTGLCKRDQRKLSVGPAHTYIGSDSPLVTRHHGNWRLKVLEQATQLSEQDLMFTGPLTISAQDALEVRELLVKMVEKIKSTVDKTEPEELYCLNIDWVKIKK